MNGDRREVMGATIGGLAPIAVGAMLVPLRDELVSTNLALILVVVVVAAAVAGGRSAGMLAAITATLSFDFFLTKPYLNLRIDSADDVETAVLLLIVGLLVGQLSVRSSRHRATAEAGHVEIQRIHRVVDLLARGASTEEILRAAQDELTQLLGLSECRFEPVPFGLPLARLERSGTLTGNTEWRVAKGGFELPAEGVELPVLSHGRQVGRFVLEPTPGVGSSLEARVVAVAIADQVGAAMHGAPAADGQAG